MIISIPAVFNASYGINLNIIVISWRLMVPGESDAATSLKLLTRLLEKGLVMNKDEAEEYKEFLKPLLNRGLVVRDKGSFRMLPECCILLLQHLVESGVGLEKIFKSVNWRGFERVIAEGFRLEGYRVWEHFRFRLGKRLREIDVLVETPMLFVSIDCKQWLRRNYNTRLACRLQVERSRLLSEYLAERGLRKEVYPVVVTFLDSEARVLEGCLVVPVWVIRNMAEFPETLRTLGEPISLF
jgi:hypothetical protein